MKQCLIIVDYQNDFVDGALGFEKAVEIEDHIVQKIKAYKANHHDVIFTLDTHDDNYLEKEEGKNLPVKHCIKGTKGHELRPKIKALKAPSDRLFEKHTFPSLDLGNYLKSKAYDTIELAGVVSNICVISNAVIAKAALPNAHIIVDAKATASNDEDLHEASLDVMEGLHIEIKNRG